MGEAQGVAAVFDRAAPTYDQVGVELFGPVADLLVRELDPQPGERVLDVGCGRGAVLLRVAQRGGAATGIDVSPVMVEGARDAARRAGLDVSVRVADALEPGPPDAFEAVASSLVLFFLPDPVGALAAWRRVLVDGGRVVVTTYGPVSEPWRPVDAELLRHLPAGARDPRTTGQAGSFASTAGVERLLTDAGLRDVRTVTSTVPVRYADVDQWYRWSWSVSQRTAWEAVPEQDRPALRRRLEELLEQARLPDGALGFDQVVRCTVGRR